MLLQDLQGSQIRVGDLPESGIMLTEGEYLTLVPIAYNLDSTGQVINKKILND